MSSWWRSWLDPDDYVTLVLAAGLGFMWGTVSLLPYPLSVATFPFLAKVLVDILVWPLTIAILISYGAHSALGLDFPFLMLAPIIGAMGGITIAMVTFWHQRRSVQL